MACGVDGGEAAAVRRREACLRAHAVEYFTHPAAVCVVLLHSPCECCHLLVALILHSMHTQIVGEFGRLAFQRGEFLLHRLPAECTDIGFRTQGGGSAVCLQRGNASVARRYHGPFTHPTAGTPIAVRGCVAMQRQAHKCRVGIGGKEI